MTQTETHNHIERCLASFKRIETVYESLKRTFDAHREYLDAVMVLVGDDDKWLEWYIWENGCGKNAFEAKAATWKRPRKIRTVDDLVTIIVDSRR